MKKIYLLIAVAATLFAGVSCDRTDPYLYGGETEKTSFVTLDQESSVSVVEDEGTFTVAVRVVGTHKKFTVALDVKDDTAIKGTHYDLVDPADGQLVFGPKESVKNITFSLTRIPGYVDPGRVEFSMSLASATEGITIGNRSNLSVTITDADHPLKNFIGTWTAHVVDDWGDNYDLAVGVTADANDLMTLHFSGLAPWLASQGYNMATAAGTSSEDMKTITIDKDQPTGLASGGVSVVYSGFDESGNDVDILVHDNGDDTITLDAPYIGAYALGTTTFYDLYEGPVVLTRK